MKMSCKYRPWLNVIAACFLLVASTQAQEEAFDVDDSIIPQRPPSHIFDPAKWLSPDEEDSIQLQLAKQYKEHDIDIYIVTRAKQPVQGAKTYARALGEAWSRAPVWCVIFYVPGDPSGFHVQAGGLGLDPARVNRAVSEASRRARREMTEKDRVMAAWGECAEVLRFMHNARDLSNEAVAEKRNELRGEWISKEKWKRIIMVSGIGLLVLLVASAYFFFSSTRKKRCPAVYHFPDTAWRKRYQAPYSGGSGVVASCRRKKRSP